jgi:glycine cleavage system H protein
MADKYFSEDHEWIEVEDGIGTVGITDYAQEQLGEVVFVELPDVGAIFDQGDDMCVVESVKAASEVYAPVAGEVVEVNEPLVDKPDGVNDDAEGDGWFVKIKIADKDELDDLMSEKAYKAFITDLD